MGLLKWLVAVKLLENEPTSVPGVVDPFVMSPIADLALAFFLVVSIIAGLIWVAWKTKQEWS
jgi:hypothetical protein